MLSPKRILTWLRANVHQMRLSRLKTLAAIVAGAVRKSGVGVLALGRAMAGPVGAKHCIKRVWRFLRNKAVEVEAVSAPSCGSARRRRADNRAGRLDGPVAVPDPGPGTAARRAGVTGVLQDHKKGCRRGGLDDRGRKAGSGGHGAPGA